MTEQGSPSSHFFLLESYTTPCLREPRRLPQIISRQPCTKVTLQRNIRHKVMPFPPIPLSKTTPLQRPPQLYINGRAGSTAHNERKRNLTGSRMYLPDLILSVLQIVGVATNHNKNYSPSTKVQSYNP